MLVNKNDLAEPSVIYLTLGTIEEYRLKIIFTGQQVRQTSFVLSTDQTIAPYLVDQDKEFAQILKTKLTQYFSDPRLDWQLDNNLMTIKTTGTPFQQKVWSQITKIPVGETRHYGQIAQLLNCGHKGSGARAVANACRKNPLPIFIPCHRVVAKHHIGGYDGDSYDPLQKNKLMIKMLLLDLELQTVGNR